MLRSNEMIIIIVWEMLAFGNHAVHCNHNSNIKLLQSIFSIFFIIVWLHVKVLKILKFINFQKAIFLKFFSTFQMAI